MIIVLKEKLVSSDKIKRQRAEAIKLNALEGTETESVSGKYPDSVGGRRRLEVSRVLDWADSNVVFDVELQSELDVSDSCSRKLLNHTASLTTWV